MYTRKDYMNNECSHREYYAQFVNQSVISRVLSVIGKDKILASNDEHLNDIPLNLWDSMGATHSEALRACGDSPSLAGYVCIRKEAARQIKEANK